MNSVRSSQRPPRSCTRCAKRRVRCDKKIPCQECLSRGLEVSCERETVRVKGKLVSTTYTELSGPSYQALLEENLRLKAELSGKTVGTSLTNNCARGEILNISESFERDLFAVVNVTGRTPTVSDLGHIYWPSNTLVINLLSYGKTWTSWIHYALDHPKFEAECQTFLEDTTVVTEPQQDSLWLAIYFSFMSAVLIFMDESQVKAAGASHDVNELLYNWYDAALYFLYKGDFLRNYDIRSVQAIAILGIVFNNVGDIKLHNTLWAVAIRIAQSLDLGDDRCHTNEPLSTREMRRRLWWTLIICEWLPGPDHKSTFCIMENDFHVELPALLDDNELASSTTNPNLQIRPVEYHIGMIKLCILYQRFVCALRLCSSKTRDIAALVLKSDEALANLIEELPPHLRGNHAPIDVAMEERSPWIPWQRNNLSAVLFYYRIAINRTLQDRWVQDPETFARTRAICVGSARSIISLAADCAKSLSRHRPWATSLQIFSAAIILAVEVRFHEEATADYLDDIKFSIDFLNGVKDRSLIAAKAADILLQQFPRTETVSNTT